LLRSGLNGKKYKWQTKASVAADRAAGGSGGETDTGKSGGSSTSHGKNATGTASIGGVSAPTFQHSSSVVNIQDFKFSKDKTGEIQPFTLQQIQDMPKTRGLSFGNVPQSDILKAYQNRNSFVSTASIGGVSGYDISNQDLNPAVMTGFLAGQEELYPEDKGLLYNLGSGLGSGMGGFGEGLGGSSWFENLKSSGIWLLVGAVAVLIFTNRRK